MDISYIDILLNKYWEAETTPQEEYTLKSYFNGTDVLDRHKEFSPIFQSYSSFTQAQAHDDLFSEYGMMSKLLDKYYNAESSIEEEHILRSYFTGGNVDKRLEVHTPIFNWQKQIGSITAPAENIAAKKINPGTASIFTLKRMIAIAAMFVFVIAAVLVMKQYTGMVEKPSLAANYKEIEDPQEAYEVTMAALAKVSRKYKKGSAHLADGMANVNDASVFKYTE